MTFYLGTHQPAWLGTAGVPLFVSARRLRGRRSYHRAKANWALDSGGFTELSMHGRWATPPGQYAEEVAAWGDAVGRMDWAAIQDWMCEDVVRAKTGKSVVEHQELTVQSYLTLAGLAPTLPWTPVLQGWARDDYLAHVEMYAAAGVRLADLPVVGLGSVCRRQATGMVEGLVRDLAGTGVSLHGFGFKLLGLGKVAGHLRSSDSLAWSFVARRSEPLDECRRDSNHKNCANCMRYALRWRERVVAVADSAVERARPAAWASGRLF